MTRIYLDHNATAPILPEVATAMADCYALGHGNPASQHFAGRRARQVVEDCREAIGRLLGAEVDSVEPDRIIFTSGGTEANNLAILGLCTDPAAGVAISTIEHPSIVGPAERLAHDGFRFERLRVNSAGVADLDHLSAILRRPPRLLSLMLGNNETGVLQPVAEAARQCAQAGVLLHTDAVQVVGKLPLDFRSLGVAALSLSAHKFHGPVGIGALILRAGVSLSPQLVGGHQQQGLRPGTESVALIVGLRAALECWHREHEQRTARMKELRDQFERQLLAAMPGNRHQRARVSSAAAYQQHFVSRGRSPGFGDGFGPGRHRLFDRFGLRQRVERAFSGAGGHGLAGGANCRLPCAIAWGPEPRPATSPRPLLLSRRYTRIYATNI